MPETIPVTTMWGRVHGKKFKTQAELLTHLNKKLGPGGIQTVNGAPAYVPSDPDGTSVPLMSRKGKFTYMKPHLMRQVNRKARRRGLLPPKEKKAGGFGVGRISRLAREIGPVGDVLARRGAAQARALTPLEAAKAMLKQPAVSATPDAEALALAKGIDPDLFKLFGQLKTGAARHTMADLSPAGASLMRKYMADPTVGSLKNFTDLDITEAAMHFGNKAPLKSFLKEAQAPAAMEAVMSAWARLPTAAKGAIIGAPIGALTTGGGELMLNRKMDDGSSAAQHMYGSMADRARRMRDSSEDPGFARKLLAETGGHAENLADITTEHPVKSALIAALLGSALGAGAGAATGATLRMLPQAASAVR
jgi:hypothetical protein